MKEIIKRLNNVDISPETATYKPTVSTERLRRLKEQYPSLFEEFEAVSIGDDNGTVCLVPLDECDRETAQVVLKALNEYKSTESEHKPK